MRVIIRIELIDRARAERFIRIGHVLAVVDKRAAGSSSSVAAVADKAIGGVGVGAGFPDVVWRRGREDYGCAFGLEEFCGVFFVGGVGEDGFGDAAVVFGRVVSPAQGGE